MRNIFLFMSGKLILPLCFVLLTSFSAANAKSRAPGFWIEGPVRAEVIRVIDGDTVEVRAYPWPQQTVTVKVRLRGIDAPEIHTKCATEKRRGYAARDALQNMLNNIRSISLTNISGGKYFGRVLANLELEGGYNASGLLLDAGLVRAYEGGKRAKPSCR